MYSHGSLGKHNHSSIYAGIRMSKAARHLYIDDFAQYPIYGPSSYPLDGIIGRRILDPVLPPV
jgi:hypothetical protein